MTLNIVTDDGEDVTLEFIESRAEAGLVFRVAGEPPKAALAEFADGLTAALRSSPHHVFRVCCDSAPGGGHLGTCENSMMRGGAKVGGKN